MSQPYVGEIRMFGGNFAPAGWEFCAGQLIPISENETLFQLIGTTYGGDGESTFALPDMRGRVPVHNGVRAGMNSISIGEMGGVESVALTTTQIPNHRHGVLASRDPASSLYDASTGVPAVVAGTSVYGPIGTPAAMAANVVLPGGAGTAHDNMAPYLCVNFIISMYGIFPSQN